MDTDPELPRGRGTLFVVRLADAGPSLSGRVEHVLTGEKRLFDGLEELGRAIRLMAGRHEDGRDAAEPTGEVR